jgi:hypothetical protein
LRHKLTHDLDQPPHARNPGDCGPSNQVLEECRLQQPPDANVFYQKLEQALNALSTDADAPLPSIGEE